MHLETQFIPYCASAAETTRFAPRWDEFSSTALNEKKFLTTKKKKKEVKSNVFEL